MARTHECKDCPLNHGESHQVPDRDVEHRVLVARYRVDATAAALQQSPRSVDQLAELMTGITLTDEGPNVRQQPSAPQQSPQSIEELADLMTGITLTDEGPNVRQQPSKFFSSRDEFQDGAEIPTSPTLVPITIAQQSIQKVLRSIKHPGMRSVERNQGLLLDIKKQVRTARESLAGIDLLYADNNHHESMRMSVNAATQVVIDSGMRFRSVNTSKGGADLTQLRDELLEELRELDQRIDCLGALLPKEAVIEEEPLQYDATHVEENPVGHLDLIAQMTALLGVVCNVVIGLSTKPCDLILQTVQMIIRLVMSMALPPDAEEYNAHQTHVLNQLPKSLHAALDAFKLDAKTTVYATCPACHFTHAPKIDRITGDRAYPSVCNNYTLEADTQRQCSKPLLEDRDGKPRPIKPYLYVSFMDHLARLLSDPRLEEIHGLSRKAPPEFIENVFESDFLRAFQGPGKQKLFINRGGRMRLALEAKKKERGPVAFEQDWVAYDLGQVPPRYVLVNPEKEERQISSIQARLIAPLALDDEDPVDEPLVDQDDENQEMPPVPEALLADGELEKLRKAIAKCNLPPIRFVTRSLGLSMGGVKADFVQKLITWRLAQPLAGFQQVWTPYVDEGTATYRLKDHEIQHLSTIQSALTMRLAVRESEALPDGPAPPPAAHPVPSSDPKVEKAAAVLTSALKSYNRSTKLEHEFTTSPYPDVQEPRKHFVVLSLFLQSFTFTATISWGPRMDPIPVWINSTPAMVSRDSQTARPRQISHGMKGNLVHTAYLRSPQQTHLVQAPIPGIDPNLFTPSISTRPHEIHPTLSHTQNLRPFLTFHIA
ncbi:hypothetical protein B0H13DRAFT_1892527 [Mycena leptocephala]|nr:hypothetical protein B0H13DRAFT_1892527 [Mycena leptocephala]